MADFNFSTDGKSVVEKWSQFVKGKTGKFEPDLTTRSFH